MPYFVRLHKSGAHIALNARFYIKGTFLNYQSYQKCHLFEKMPSFCKDLNNFSKLSLKLFFRLAYAGQNQNNGWNSKKSGVILSSLNFWPQSMMSLHFQKLEEDMQLLIFYFSFSASYHFSEMISPLEAGIEGILC